MKLSSFPILETKRLILREILKSDADMILFLRSDLKVNAFIERPPERITKTKADALDFIDRITLAGGNNESCSWGITNKQDDKLIGTICLWNFSCDRQKAEVGYDLHHEFQNQGIMTEALKRVIEFGFFELNLSKIEAFTQNRNENSKKLLVKSGFIQNEKRVDQGNNKNLIFELLVTTA